MSISLLDLFIILLYFASMVGIGLIVSKKNRSTDQYFLAGKSFGGWIVGISLIGSIISSVTFIAIPADAFKTAWLRFVPNLAFPIVAFLSAWLFIPFYRRGTITSAYGYLAARFGPSISYYAAFIFLIAQIAKTSTIAYLLSILLESITGWNFTLCLLVVTGVTMIYTIKGGAEAVIWTDVIQTGILLMGAIVCIGYIVHALPHGFTTLFADATAHHKLSVAHDLTASMAEPSTRALIDAALPAGAEAASTQNAVLDLHARGLSPLQTGMNFSEKTVLMMFLLGFFQFLSVITDQSTVQRWCSARTATEARRSMVVLGLGCLPVWALFQLLGTSLYVYFLHLPDRFAQETLLGLRKAEHILPYFITHSLPAGLVGLVIAGALAAAMSTLSASINTSSMVIVNDLYKRLLPATRSDQFYLSFSKGSSLAVSLLMIGGALLIRVLDAPTLTDLSQQISAVITCGVPGIFLGGILTRRINTAGAWGGLIASAAFLLWAKGASFLPASLHLPILPHYLAIAGNIITFAASFLISMVAGKPTQSLENLTLWDQSEKPLE